MAKKRAKKVIKQSVAKKAALGKVPDKSAPTLAIIALVLNIIVPGLGSIIGGRIKTGISQLVLLAIALATILLFPIAVFYVLWAVVWIWALITGIQIVKKS